MGVSPHATGKLGSQGNLAGSVSSDHKTSFLEVFKPKHSSHEADAHKFVGLGRDPGAYDGSPLQMARVHQGLVQQTMPYQDKIFSVKEWDKHHSFMRYMPEPRKLLHLVVHLFLPLTWVTLISVACGLYQQLRASHQPNLDNLQVSFAYSLCSFALSLLLVFKTNASYARWQDARTAWSSIYANIRSLAMKTEALTDATMSNKQRQLFVRWLIVMPYALRSHLLSYAPGTLVLEPLLTEKECAWLQQRGHMPVAVAQVVSVMLAKTQLAPVPLASINIELANFTANVAILERISRTPIPMAYTRHTVRFLVIYLSLLPLALWTFIGWYTVLVAPTITLLFTGIENIGNQIENPVLVLPMAGYCSKVHLDVISMTEHWVEEGPESASSFVDATLAADVPEWQQKRPPGVQSADGALHSASKEASLDVKVAERCMGTVADTDDDEACTLSMPRPLPGDEASGVEEVSTGAFMDHDLPGGERLSFAGLRTVLSGGSRARTSTERRDPYALHP